MEASRQLNALLLNTSLESRVQVPSRRDNVANLVREAVSTLHAQQPSWKASRSSSRIFQSCRSLRRCRDRSQVLAILEQKLLVVSLSKTSSTRASRSRSVPNTASNRCRRVPHRRAGHHRRRARRRRRTARANAHEVREAIAAAEAVSAQLTRHFAGADDRG